MFRRGNSEHERGQALVEFAMVMPIMLLLLFALVDFGRAFYSWLLITNAAREGARVAATQSPLTDVETRVYDAASALDAASITITTTNVQGPRGEIVRVNLAYSFSFVTPIGDLAALVGGSSISAPTITGQSSMRLE